MTENAAYFAAALHLGMLRVIYEDYMCKKKQSLSI